jgi:dolichyl-phosphate-mannose-protein mannosyltransferase
MKFSRWTLWTPDEHAQAMLIVFLSFTLRVFHLGSQAIWWDESLSLYRATHDLPTIVANTIVIQNVVTTDLQPPLYFLMLHFLVGAFGTSEFALRFLSLGANVGAVALLYALGRRIFSERVGLLASLLGALSPFYVWFAQEARPYALLLFFCLLGMYALARLTQLSPSAYQRNGPSGGSWALVYVLSTIAALYTNYYAVFLLPFHALFLIARVWRDSSARRLILLPVLPSLSAVFLLPFILRGAAGNVNSGPSFVPLGVILRDLINSFSVGITLGTGQAGWIDASMLLIFLIGLVSTDPRITSYAARLTPLAFVLVPTIAIYFFSYIRPLYQNSRYLIAASPGFYLGLAVGVAALGHQRRFVALPALGIFVVGAIFSLNNLYFDPRYGKDDHRAWADSLRERSQPGDFLILDSPHAEELFKYYAGDVVPYVTLPILSDFGSQPSAYDADTAAVRDALARNGRVWLLSMHAPFDDPEGRIEKSLNQEGVLLDWANFRGTSTAITLSLYERMLPTVDASEIAHPLNFVFDSRLRLVGLDTPQEYKAGERSIVKLFWQLDEPAGEDYGVSLRAVSESGARVAQWDSVPLGNRAGSSTWIPKTIMVDSHDLLFDPGILPGRYGLEIQVYHPATGNGIGDAVRIGEIAVIQ